MNNVKLARKFLWALILTAVCSRGFAIDTTDIVNAVENGTRAAANEVAKPGRFASAWNTVSGLGSSAFNWGWNGVTATASTVKNAGSTTWGAVTSPRATATTAYNATVNGLTTAGSVVLHPVATTQAAYKVAPKTTIAVCTGVVAATAVVGYLYGHKLKGLVPARLTAKAPASTPASTTPAAPAKQSFYSRLTGYFTGKAKAEEAKAKAEEAAKAASKADAVKLMTADVNAVTQYMGAASVPTSFANFAKTNKAFAQVSAEFTTRLGQLQNQATAQINDERASVIADFTAKIKAVKA